MSTPAPTAAASLTGRLIMTCHDPDRARLRARRRSGPHRVLSTAGLSPEQAAHWLADAPLLEICDSGIYVVDPADSTANDLAVEAQQEGSATLEPELLLAALTVPTWSTSGGPPAPSPRGGGAGEPGGPPPVWDDEQLTWALRALGLPPVAAQGPAAGLGARVALLGTGLDPGHEALRGRVTLRGFLVDESAVDFCGHGTHCAGLIGGRRSIGPRIGVAPAAELVVAKVLDQFGIGSSAVVLAGLAWALQQNPQVICIPFGCAGTPHSPTSAAFERLAAWGLRAGTLTLCAAGDDSHRPTGRLAPVSTPASCTSMLAVGALTRALAPTDTTNRGLLPQGGAVELCAPGEELLSCALGGGLEVRAGSGCAAAIAAGAAALLTAGGGPRGVALRQELLRSARPLPGHSPLDVGAGLVQIAGSA